jgi:hypothetical protein
MLIRRYIFVEGPYRGTAKLSPDGTDRVLVEILVDSVVQEEIKAYLTGKGGELAFYLGPCKKEGNKMRLRASFREKQLQDKHINLSECGCIVLPALKEGKEKMEEENQYKIGLDQEWSIGKGTCAQFSNSYKPHKEGTRLPSFEESFGLSYGLKWQVCSFDDLTDSSGLISAVLLNQGSIECINRYGGFYYGEREEDVKVIGIPARMGKDPLPCINIFRYLSYLKEKNEKFGCYMIGLNQKSGVLFPAIFE